MACSYCFYADKVSLFGPGRHRMSDEVLERLISDYMSLGFAVSNFAWQGGEPALMGLDFYKKVVELQQMYGRSGLAVSNAFQTNGILLDEKWCKFLAKHKFLVGISLDGPKEMHDYYRRDKSGKGTFDRVMAAIGRCRASNVEFNVLVLLNNKNVMAADELFDFFIGSDIKYLQFVPCIEKSTAEGRVADFSITPEQYADFLCRMFDRWNGLAPDRVSIRMFDSILSYYLTGQHSICTFARKCDEYVVVEHNGDVFCCDFFVGDEWRLGNIFEAGIAKLATSGKKRIFADYKHNLCDKCFVCRYSDICQGGCLKDRVALDGDYTHPSYFCQSYRRFFDYALPRFKQAAASLAAGRSSVRPRGH